MLKKIGCFLFLLTVPLALMFTGASFIILALLAMQPLPPTPSSVVTVRASYPKADAQTVAETVAAPIEQQVEGVEQAAFLWSESASDGSYTLHVVFKPGMDMETAKVLVQNRVAFALPVIPDDVQKGKVAVDQGVVGAVPVGLVIYGPDSAEVWRLGREVAARLKKTGKVDDATVGPGSGKAPRWSVEVDRVKAQQLGVNVASVFAALEEAFGPGEAKGDDAGKAWQFKDDPPADALNSFKELKVRNRRGDMVSVDALATLRRTLGSDAIARYDQQPAVRLTTRPASPAGIRTLSLSLVKEVCEELKLPDYRAAWLEAGR